MKHLFIIIALFFSFQTFAQTKGYYDGTDGLEGEALREKLRTIITSGHSSNSYDGLDEDYKITDNYTVHGGNRVWDMYSLHNDGISANYWFYHIAADQCGNYSIEGDCYNKEHSVPQSWFGSNHPMQADLFMVYPTDGKVNGMRSNFPYGETSAKTTSTNGSKAGSCTYPGYSGTVFEPIDRFKGDFARTYFYVATRYKNSVEGWSGNADVVFTGNNLSTWQINMLLTWHQQDPVSTKETARNDAVQLLQGNRNPFIDHPEWAECIWSTCGVQNPASITADGTTVSEIEVNWDLNGSGEDIVLAYNTTNTFGTPTGTYVAGNTIAGGGNVLYVGTSTSFSHTGLASQTYYYKLWSYDGTEYSNGIEAQASPILAEPTNNPTAFTVTNEQSTTITLTWNDATGGILPTNYLIKASTGTVNSPTDGNFVANSTFNKNINYGEETVIFASLSSETTYNFKIFPYTNSGASVDYKTTGNLSASGTTTVATNASLIITEIAGKGFGENYLDEYIEISNVGGVSANLANWTLEYYEGSAIEEDMNLTGTIAPLSTYIISVRTNFTSAISPDFEADFSINDPCYVVLKENGTIKDQAGSSSDKFDAKNKNYEFTNCADDNLPVSNWTDLNLTNGTPGDLDCSNISVEDITSKIKIYPNPANDIVNIISSEKIKEIKMYDVFGKKCLNKLNISVKEYELNINTLTKGIYFIEINDFDNNKVLKKLIVK